MILSRQGIYGVGLLAAALTAAVLAVANFVGAEPGEHGGGAEYAVTLGLSLLVAAAIFGWAIPRSGRPGYVGVVVGTLAILSIAAFWSGLPYVLGPAAVVLGLLGRGRAGQRGPAIVAVALGVLATAGSIAVLIVDQAT